MKALQWIVFISKRFSKVDRKGRTAVTSWLASVGVCFGVMALTVIMAVMNGFQMSFIDSIMEISSYHIRVSNLLPEEEKSFFEFCNNNNKISCVVPFSEAQGLMVSKRDCQTASLVRSVPENIMQVDSGFMKELKITSGKFDLSENDSIVIGNTIAYNLGLRKGSKVNIAALSGSSDTALLSLNRIFTVKGIFYSGYADINSSYSFINSQAGEINFGKDAPIIYGLKLKSTNDDMLVLNQIKSKFNNASVVSWRDFNRSFLDRKSVV